MNEVGAILSDMGYEAGQIHSAGSNKYTHMQFQIPGGEAIKLGLSLDKQFSAQVFHPEDAPDTNAEAFRRQEEKLCSHLPKLREKLKEKGLLYTIEVEKKIHEVEQALAGRGRVLVRYSGTELLARVMLEGEDEKQINAMAQDIANEIRAEVGK